MEAFPPLSTALRTEFETEQGRYMVHYFPHAAPYPAQPYAYPQQPPVLITQPVETYTVQKEMSPEESEFLAGPLMAAVTQRLQSMAAPQPQSSPIGKRAGRSICEHGRQRCRCKQCGGGSICVHGRRRTVCKECGGSDFCAHGRRRSICIDCGGGSMCHHGRRRTVCKLCGGSGICEHNRVRRTCKVCSHDSLQTCPDPSNSTGTSSPVCNSAGSTSPTGGRSP